MLDEAKIREAVEKAKAAGWTIAARRTVAPLDKRCCPLGALALSVTTDELWSPEDCLLSIGVGPDEFCGFARGFDGALPAGNEPAYRLGAQFRRELLGDDHA